MSRAAGPLGPEVCAWLAQLASRSLAWADAVPVRQAGTTLAGLKARMGHDSARATLIYHATSADRKIAKALGKAIQQSHRHTPGGRDAWGSRHPLMAR